MKKSAVIEQLYYQNDDEFRLACDAFNGMALYLQEADATQRKDEANRRNLSPEFRTTSARRLHR